MWYFPPSGLLRAIMSPFSHGLKLEFGCDQSVCMQLLFRISPMISFLFPIQKMKSLAQRRQSAPSLIFVKALTRFRSASRWVSEFCWLYCFAVSQPKTWNIFELLSTPGCWTQFRLLGSCMAIKPAERCDRTSPGTGWSPRGGFLSAATLSCSYLTGWAGLLYNLQPGVRHLGCSVVNSLWLAGIACCGDGMGRRRWMNACCLGHLHSVWRNSGLFIVELHNLIWAKFFLSLPAARYRLSRALEAPAGSGQGCGPGSGDHSLPLSSISTCGAEYVGVKHSASFVLGFCQNQPSFLPPSVPPSSNLKLP